MFGGDFGPDEIIDNHYDVFGRRIQLCEFRCIEVEILMIKAVEDLSPDNSRKLGKVDDITGIGVWYAGQFYDKFVVMTVVMRVAALAKNAKILFIAPFRNKQPVRRIKMFFPENRNFSFHTGN